MASTISYTIKLLDQFSDVSKTVYANAVKMDSVIQRHSKTVKQTANSYENLKTKSVSSSDATLKAVRRVTKTVDVAKEKVKELKKQFEVLNKTGAGIRNVGRDLTTRLTVPIVGFGIASVKSSMDFRKSMASVGTMIPGQSERLKRLSGEVLNLSIETGKGAKIISEGLYETISAFGEAEPPMNKLRIATRMSVAGNASVVDSLKLVSAVTKGYGDISDESAQRVSDMAFKVVELGQTTFPELAASMGRVVPIAASMNIKQRELFTSFATLTGVTGTASEVSTQLSAIMSAMLKPSEALTTTVKKLGYTSASTMVGELGLHKSLMMINDAIDGNTDKMAEMLGRKEALVGALALTGAQSTVFTDKIRKMEQVIGATDKAYMEQTAGFNKAGFTWEQAKQRAFKMSVVIGDKLLPQLEKLFAFLEPYINKISDASDEQLSFGIKIAAMVAAIGPAMMVIGKATTLISAFGSGLTAVGGAGGALALMTGPVGIAAIAIAGLAAITVYCWDELENLRTAIADGLSPVIGDLTGDTGGLKTNLYAVGNVLRTSVGFVTSATAPFVKLGLKIGTLPLRGMIQGFKVAQQVVGVFSNAINIVSSALSIAWNWVARVGAEWLNSSAAGRVVLQVLDHMSNAFDNVTEYVKSLWEQVENFFGSVSGWLGKIGVKMGETADEQKMLKEQAMSKMNIDAAKGALSTNVSFAPATGTLESSTKIDLNIKAPEGTVKEVKTRTKNSYANVNVGKNED